MSADDPSFGAIVIIQANTGRIMNTSIIHWNVVAIVVFATVRVVEQHTYSDSLARIKERETLANCFTP